MKMLDRAASSSSSSPPSSSAGDTWFVAVSREVKESESVLLWAIQNLNNPRRTEICILHVHRPDKQIPNGLTWLPIELANEHQINSHRAIEREKMCDKLDKYLQICRQRGVKARKIYVEMESMEEGIVKLLSENEVGKLVMGAASDRRYRKGMVEMRSEKAKYVNKHAPGHCHIWFVCNKLLIHTRAATVQSGNLNPAPLDHDDTPDGTGDRPKIQWGRIPSAPPRHPDLSEDDRLNKVDTWILMEKIGSLEDEKAKLSNELEGALYRAYALDTKLEKSDFKAKELERLLESAMQLGSFKIEQDEMQRLSIRRDEEVMKQLDDGAPSIDFLMFFSEFPTLEIRSATNSFDPSLKIGEDAYGHIYRGFLHCTEVAVKIPHLDNPSIHQEFQLEACIFVLGYESTSLMYWA